jgi:hypothetical protein
MQQLLAEPIEADHRDEMFLIGKFLFDTLNGLHDFVEALQYTVFDGFHRSAFVEDDEVVDLMFLVHGRSNLRGDKYFLRL